MISTMSHPFDLRIEEVGALDLFAEELPDQINLLSDCASSASSLSSVGGCIGCFSSMGSIISCG